MKLYRKLAFLIEWHNRTENGKKQEINDSIKKLVRDHMPSGSGVDMRTKIDLISCNEKRIVFNFSFHHMNENGLYDGWTEHTLIIKPSFTDFDMSITGRNQNDIKEYFYDVYNEALNQEV